MEKTVTAVASDAPRQWPLQSQCDAFYGDPRPRNAHEAYNVAWAKANLVHVTCPWSLTDFKHHFSAIQIHKKAAPSLARVLARVWDDVGRSEAKIHELRYDVFSGSFVYRRKRGAASLSMHAYGVAIDWDAPDNPMHARRHLFTDDSPLIRAFKREGWVWGGDWAGDGVDAMHVQAARVHR